MSGHRQTTLISSLLLSRLQESPSHLQMPVSQSKPCQMWGLISQGYPGYSHINYLTTPLRAKRFCQPCRFQHLTSLWHPTYVVDSLLWLTVYYIMLCNNIQSAEANKDWGQILSLLKVYTIMQNLISALPFPFVPLSYFPLILIFGQNIVPFILQSHPCLSQSYDLICSWRTKSREASWLNRENWHSGY